MDVLVLGGTAWVGREIAREALARGHRVTCLARGQSGSVADGADLVVADRGASAGLDVLAGRCFDAVLDVSWQPGFVRSAVAALGKHAGHWTYISSGNVYAAFASAGANESAPLRSPTDLAEVGGDLYGKAKVACEQACASALEDRLLVARAGLIGGPGDASGRSGAWVARAAAAPVEAMVVPDAPEAATQVVDVRDLVAWVIRCAEGGTTGTYDVVGPVVPFPEWVRLSRSVGGHTGAVVLAAPAWLLGQGVEEFMGPESMAMWHADPAYAGFSARSGAAAQAAGLTHRTREQLLADVLAWEREQGLERDRPSGLSRHRERELLAALTGH